MRRLLILAFTMLNVLCLCAQDGPTDYDLYMQASNDATILLRGRAAINYDIAYNGTYFISSPEFVKGELRYNGKMYHDVYLNIDAVRQDLLVRHPKGIAQVLLTRNSVEWFTMGERRFVNLEKYVEGAPQGYFEVLFDGESKFYGFTRKSLEQDLNGSMSGLIGEQSDNYDSRIHSTFVLKRSWYYLTKSGELTLVRNKKGFLRLLPKADRRKISKVIERNGTSTEDFIVSALEYLEK